MIQKIKFLLIVLLSAQLGLAQTKNCDAVRLGDTLPVIDGVIDDIAWEKASWENSFTEYKPNNGEKPSQRTSFKILYDDNNIYFAIKAYDTDVDKIEKRMTRRDGWEGDRVGIELDTYQDKRTSFMFYVNAAGVKSDGIMTDDGNNMDDSWDPIWFTKTSIDKEGWYAEIKIPLSQLRFSSRDEQAWGIQIIRNFFRESEMSLWQHIPSDASGWVSNYGEVHGLKGLKPKQQIEIAPFLVGKYDSYQKENGNPYATGSEFGFNAGVDGKIGLTNNLILDFTINPDFGQVEADPSELNLTAFESYFSEKRPFFIEGSNITDYQITPGGHPWAMDNLFYSRRIGRIPHGSPELEENEYTKVPQSTKILGAFKLTGKTNDGWSFGIIESIGNKEKAKIYGEGVEREEIVEPYTNYLITRVQKDINKGNTIIGGMFTSTNRKLEDTDLDYLPKKAITGGLDFKQLFLEKKYFVSLKLITSKVEGSEEAILEQQLSSRRYYQRPDENYYRLDSSLTSLSGNGGTILFGRQANSGLRFTFNATWRSPGFELNDVGFLRQANTVFQYFWVGYSITKPFSIFRRINFNANQWSGWDYSNVNLFNGGNIGVNTEFKNQWMFGTGFNLESDEISNSALWGGPSMKLPGNYNYYFFLSSNQTKKIFAETSFYNSVGQENYQHSYGIDASINYRPVNNLSFSLQPAIMHNQTELQIIDNISYNNESRYVFGSLEQKTFALTARIDFNITPDLTIQYYGSPFITAGDFTEFKNITDPKAENYTDRFYVYGPEITYSEEEQVYYIDESVDGTPDYSFGNPNFNFKQFRSNLVVRWEYSPGSLIYFVWSQGKTDDSYNQFDYMNNFDKLFSAPGHNTFMIKISHRLRADRVKSK